ncbi:MAG TPA: hypothetical protein EYQ24_00355 [Bacteroidetes bacterium]|nr:hypothetical protein [Bacteroidota bacterium]HIL57682.1 hypothetical protein [Rhodothermales bacterium]
MRLLLLVLLALPLSAAAQDDAHPPLISRGTLLIDGRAHASRTTDDLTEHMAVAASPRLGVFVTDALAVGADVRAGYSRQTVETLGQSERTTRLYAAPFVAYYLGAPAWTVRPFASTSVGGEAVRTTREGPTGTPTIRTTRLSGEFSAGALVRLGTNVGLTGEAVYGWSRALDEGATSLRGGVAVFLGR